MASSKNYKMKAYQTLKQLILSNELQPNEYLEEKKLCDFLGISRTPIREAISVLEQEDLVQVIPNKGIFVSGLSIQSVRELFEARHLLEPIVLQRAFNNLDFDIIMDFKEKFIINLEKKDYPCLHQLDYDFHNYINGCCKNSYLIKIMKNISDQFQRVRTQEFYSKERTENGANEHLQLIELFIQGDCQKAIDLLQKHICSTEQYYFQSLL